MKKTAIAILGLLLCFNSLNHIQAKSIETLDKSGQIVNAGYLQQMIYDGEEAKVIYGSNGIDILKGDEIIHLDTIFPVKKLAVVSDADGDGRDDFFVYEASTDNTDQLFVISSKDGKVLHSMRYAHRNVDQSGNVIESNSYILKMQRFGDNVLFICNYDLILADPKSGEVINVYSASDNIWDFEESKSYILASDQDGCLAVLDKRLNLLCKEKLTEDYLVEYAYYDEGWDDSIQMIQKETSLFDLFVESKDSDVVYVTSEDGQLYMIDLAQIGQMDAFESDVSLEKEITWINAISVDSYKTNISYEYEEMKTVDGVKTGFASAAGLFTSSFMAYRIIDSNEKYLLISEFVQSEEIIENYNYSNNKTTFILFDRVSGEMVRYFAKEDGNNMAARLIDYNDDQAVLVFNCASDGKLKTTIYNKNNEPLLQNEMTASTFTNSGHMKVTAEGEGYLIESLNQGVVYVNNKFNEITYLYNTATSKLVSYDGDGYTLAFSENGKVNRLVRYNNSSEIVWQYNLDNNGNYHGIEGLICEDYNNDGIKDYLFVANNYDKNGTATYGKYTIINGKDGVLIRDQKIAVGTGYKENGSTYTIYATSTEIRVLKDQNNDGLKELLLGGSTIISSKNFGVMGEYYQWIDAEGALLNIGDANGDGFDDFVAVTNKKAQLHVSYSKGYEVEYYRNGSPVTLNEKGENESYAVVLGDIDQDGAKEFIVNDFNASGNQVFKVYNGKTMQLMYTLCKGGVSYWERITVSSLDLNHDGYLELECFSEFYYGNYLCDGKTGEPLYYYDNEGTIIDAEGFINQYYAPEYLICAETSRDNLDLLLNDAGDANGDGVNDVMIIARQYDFESGNYVRYLRINDGLTFYNIKEIPLGSTDSWYVPKLNHVKNTDDLLALVEESGFALIRENGDTIAQYALTANTFIYLDEKSILACSDSNVFVVNTEASFTIDSSIPAIITDSTLTVKWTPLVDYSTMKIYDNGILVYSGSDTETTFKLLEGKHTLTFSLSDSYGKSGMRYCEVNVAEKTNPYSWIVAPTAILLGAAITIMLYRKIYIRRKYYSMRGENA